MLVSTFGEEGHVPNNIIQFIIVISSKGWTTGPPLFYHLVLMCFMFTIRK